MNGHRKLVDRIMHTVLDEPVPTPARAFATAVRHGRLDDAAATVSVAWHLGTVRRPAVRAGIRARSLAFVVAVILSLGSISVVAGAAARAIAEQALSGLDAGRAPRQAEPPNAQGPGLAEPEPEASEEPASSDGPSPLPTSVEDDDGDPDGIGEDPPDDDRSPVDTDGDSAGEPDDADDARDAPDDESSSGERDGSGEAAADFDVAWPDSDAAETDD